MSDGGWKERRPRKESQARRRPFQKKGQDVMSRPCAKRQPHQCPTDNRSSSSLAANMCSSPRVSTFLPKASASEFLTWAPVSSACASPRLPHPNRPRAPRPTNGFNFARVFELHSCLMIDIKSKDRCGGNGCTEKLWTRNMAPWNA